MKKTFAITLILFMIQQITKAEILVQKPDTLDYWHVYYNKTKIREFNQLDRNQITLKKRNIKPDDILTIKYFNDTPCDACKIFIVVKDNRHNIVFKKEGKGTFNPISISLKQLVLSKKAEFEVFYFEEKIKNKMDEFQIFKVKLE